MTVPAPARAVAIAALMLIALPSCATQPAATPSVPAEVVTPCHGEYVADVDTSAAGEATPEAAAVAWSRSVLAPSGAPTGGWSSTDAGMERGGEQTVSSGDWIVGVSRTEPGGWLVSGLGCGAVS